MKHTRQLKALSRENTALAAQVQELKNSNGVQEMELRNSIGAIMDATRMQSAITSFNPLIQNNIYSPLTINWTLLTYLYKTHGIVQTAVDMPVLDALRGGLSLKCDEVDDEDLQNLQERIEELGILDVIGEVLVWARLYGGAALIINTDQDPSTPLDAGRIRKMELYAANRWELGSPQRLSEYYLFYGQRLHASRVITVSGKAAPYIIRWQLQGWGMSEIEKMVEDFNKYLKTSNVIYELLEEAKIDVYKFKGWNNMMISGAQMQKARERIQDLNEKKNYHGAVTLDKEDEFEQKQITFGGLAEMTKENRIGIASALRIPMTKLFGLSSAGFNSGEDDIENYNAMIESEVRQPAKKIIRKVLKLLGVVAFKEEFDITYSFKPLRVLGAVDEEAVKTSKQNRYTQLFSLNIIDSLELGTILKKEELVPIETNAEKGLLDAHPVPVLPQGAGDDGEPDATQDEEDPKAEKQDLNEDDESPAKSAAKPKGDKAKKAA